MEEIKRGIGELMIMGACVLLIIILWEACFRSWFINNEEEKTNG